jgi:hypothetical protein
MQISNGEVGIELGEEVDIPGWDKSVTLPVPRKRVGINFGEEWREKNLLPCILRVLPLLHHPSRQIPSPLPAIPCPFLPHAPSTYRFLNPKNSCSMKIIYQRSDPTLGIIVKEGVVEAAGPCPRWAAHFWPPREQQVRPDGHDESYPGVPPGMPGTCGSHRLPGC